MQEITDLLALFGLVAIIGGIFVGFIALIVRREEKNARLQRKLESAEDSAEDLSHVLGLDFNKYENGAFKVDGSYSKLRDRMLYVLDGAFVDKKQLNELQAKKK